MTVRKERKPKILEGVGTTALSRGSPPQVRTHISISDSRQQFFCVHPHGYLVLLVFHLLLVAENIMRS